MALRIVIAGAGGLIGSELLRLMLSDEEISSVTALVRKPLDVIHPKLKQLTVDFNQLMAYENEIQGDVLFCCLGSTRKKTPGLAEYRKVDYHYPMLLAEIAEKNNIKQFHIISALGADPSSSNFYSRMKGELEQDLKKFSLESFHIYQPSLLTGNRQEKRPLEKAAIVIMRFINPILRGRLKKYRSIEAGKVAGAMLKQAHKNIKGIHVYPSDKIQEHS